MYAYKSLTLSFLTLTLTFLILSVIFKATVSRTLEHKHFFQDRNKCKK